RITTFSAVPALRMSLARRKKLPMTIGTFSPIAGSGARILYNAHGRSTTASLFRSTNKGQTYGQETTRLPRIRGGSIYLPSSWMGCGEGRYSAGGGGAWLRVAYCGDVNSCVLGAGTGYGKRLARIWQRIGTLVN